MRNLEGDTPRPDPAGRQVLVLEDDPAHSELIQRAFHRDQDHYPVDLRFVVSIGQARDALNGPGDPPLVLADLRVSDGSAIDLLHEFPFIPIVVMTAQGDEAAAVQAIQAGALDYLIKSEALFRAMPQHIDRAFRQWEHIRQRRRAERALKASESRLSMLARTAPSGIFHCDPHGLCDFANEQCAVIAGISQEDLIGDGWTRAMHPDDRDRVTAGFRQAIDSAGVFTAEYRYQHPDGSSVWVHGQAAPSFAHDGSISGYVGTITNINERKKTEAALARSERYYRELFDHAHDAILIIATDERETILDANRRACEVYGYSDDELIGLSLRSISATPDGENTGIDQVLAAGGRVGYETIQYRKNGGPMNLEVNASSIEFDGQRAILTVNRDVTERTRNEVQLRRRERQFRDLLESAPDAMMIVDGDGRIQLVNGQVEKLFRVPREKLLGEHVERLVPVEVAGGHAALRKVYFEDPEQRRMGSKQLQARRFDGTHFHAEISLSPIQTPDGRLVCAAIRDVTQRLQDQEKLRKEQKRAQTYLDLAGVMLVGLDCGGTIELLNPRGCAILQANEEALLGRNWFECCVAEDERETIQNRFQHLIGNGTGNREGDSDTIEYTVVTSAGERRLVAWHNTLMRDTSGTVTGLLSSGEDVTEKRRLETHLLRSQKLDAIGQLAGGVAHDFNNVLGIILGIVELAGENLSKDKPDLHRLKADLEHIDRAGARAARMTRQLLAFGRGQEVTPIALNLNKLIRDMHPMLSRLIAEDIDLDIQLAHTIGTISADPGQVEQVVLNLALNARDAMPDGGKLTIETLMAEPDSGHGTTRPPELSGPFVELAVHDTGNGMSPEILEHIFEPFFTTKEVDKGTGLGLAVVHGHVTQCGGHVDVDSDPGIGTTVRAFFPLADQLPAAPPNEPEPAAFGAGTVLLCEDDNDLRQLAARRLIQQGYKVLEAENGDRAIEVARNHTGTIDVLVTDVIMPGLNGRQVAEALTRMCPGLKVLYVSGYAGHELEQRGVVESAVELLEKPATPQQIVTRVGAMLEAKPVGEQTDPGPGPDR